MHYDYSMSEGLLIGGLASLCLLLSTITRRIAYLKIYQFKDKLIYLLIYLIQKKIMKLKLALTLKDEEISSILNLLSGDLEIIHEMGNSIEMFSALLKTCGAVGILIWILGPIGLVGLFISFLHVPIILLLSSFMFSAKKLSKEFTDLRTGKMKNFIESIQTLKMFAWEKSFRERVNDERKNEKA